jgi:hypothetical protein
MGLRIIRGRGWDHLGPETRGVTVVDASTALDLFGTTDVVGRTIDVSQSDQPAETVSIVGVVADAIRLGSTARYSGVIYLPFRHDYGRHLVFTARATRDPAALADVIRQTLRDLDPDVAVRVAGAGPSVIGSTAQFFQISAAIASLLGTFGTSRRWTSSCWLSCPGPSSWPRCSRATCRPAGQRVSIPTPPCGEAECVLGRRIAGQR